ncbi:SMP-30/gluconolactonase/LRE family protein [Propionimicrobium sp. PCR01-08-3]|uniref:SMP-30/gluconolactonase/LRE family protein n=1 Tax=Propionimicrobium sp. PCR01-08-3 TaxID=3052086 RepID=UPI00255C6C6D|nr:SMP-30/gluconolactonase/LRE family protein [Propionimicrobium sp. PCR01-08-3]WIY82985.1 SMP-30/gluconolactonase/LRE family protein [Propionimicrobium sp. PCR01-08-3]
MTKFSDLLEPGAEVKVLAEGLTWTEGPVWLADRQACIFSDIHTNSIRAWSEPEQALSVFAGNVDFTNGRTLDLNGDIIECSHGRRGIQRRNASTGEVTMLVDHFAGVSLNSPNDVVVASDGAIWFTDPSYGIDLPGEGHPGEREYGDRWVFRFDEKTMQIWPVVTDIIAPNGLAFSPDDSVLYVCDSSNSGGEEGPGRHVRAYDIIDGRLAKWGRMLFEIDNEVPDGIKVDAEGHIWSSAGDGVRVFEPDGTEIGRITTPMRVANLAWGGDDGHTLYMCATDKFLSIRTTTTDATWARRG